MLLSKDVDYRLSFWDQYMLRLHFCCALFFLILESLLLHDILLWLYPALSSYFVCIPSLFK